MRTTFIALVLASGVIAGDAELPAPPETLSVHRTWETNADGFVYTVGYFTEAEMNDARWEGARLAARHTFQDCEGAKLVGRDVRWLPPTAASGQRCAMVVYSFTCPARRPRLGNSLEYDRQKQFLKDIDKEMKPGCGDKFSTYSTPSPTIAEMRAKQSAEREAQLSTEALCRPELDTAGSIRIQPGTRFSQRILIAPEFSDSIGPHWKANGPEGWVEAAAHATNRIHAIFSRQELFDDGSNVFVTVSFANQPDGSPYCVTLAARQGKTVWRKTLVRPGLMDESAQKGKILYGHAVSADAWTPSSDLRILSEQFAVSMGLIVRKPWPQR